MDPPSVGRTVLALWSGIAIMCLLAVVLLCLTSVDVARSALLGAPATPLVLSGVAFVALAGTWVSRGSASPRTRRVVILPMVIAAVATAVVGFGFFTGGDYAILGILLLQSAIFIGLLARALHRAGVNR